jgi:hypothetical protein
MRSLSLACLALCALSVPGRALALPTQTPYDALFLDGTDLSDAADVGIMLFDLDADTGDACRYYTEWVDDTDQPSLSISCYLDELKVEGAASCITNSSMVVPTILLNDATLPCYAWNNATVSPIFLFVAGEDPITGDVAGIIQYTAANPFVTSFLAEPYI